MAQSERGRQPPDEAGYDTWIAFWAELGVLGLLAILGAFFAAADREPGDYACGLILCIATPLLGFLRLKQRFDGRPFKWASALFVDDVANLILAIVAFAILGLVGVFVAAAVGYGGLHDAGVALFVVGAIAVLLSIKHVFDVLDHRRR